MSAWLSASAWHVCMAVPRAYCTAGIGCSEPQTSSLQNYFLVTGDCIYVSTVQGRSNFKVIDFAQNRKYI